jgi:hypothetical protein
VPVPVMQIGVMRVLVPDRCVAVPMSVGLTSRVVPLVRVLMMNVVNMPMLMLDSIVFMFVLVRFRQV